MCLVVLEMESAETADAEAPLRGSWPFNDRTQSVHTLGMGHDGDGKIKSRYHALLTP